MAIHYVASKWSSEEIGVAPTVMLQCNPEEEAAVGFYTTKGFKRHTRKKDNKNCFAMLPTSMQEGLKRAKYMFIPWSSFPMDLMKLLPYTLVLETPQEEDKDFALRFPSSTLLCSDLDQMIVKGKFLEQFIGDDPFCFDEEALLKRNLVKDVSPIAPPGRIRGIPKHVHSGQSDTSYIYGDHIVLLMELMRRNSLALG